MSIEGFEQLEANLKRLGTMGGNEGRNAARRGVTRAAAIIRNEARLRYKAHDDSATPNKIWKNIKSKAWRLRKSDKVIGASVRVENKPVPNKKEAGVAKNSDGDVFYWRFLEFGTSKQPALNLMGGSLESKESEAVNVIFDAAQEAIDKSIK